MLEDTAVAAYNGQAVNLTKPVLKAAATIVSVEARHAAWIRDIVGQPAAPQATDQAGDRAAGTAEDRRDGLREGGRMIRQLPPELDLSIDQLDRDGALQETASRPPTRAVPRRRCRCGRGIRRACITCSGPRCRRATSRFSTTRSALEYLQAAFYTETERLGAITGKAAEAMRVVGAVERAHVTAFRDLWERRRSSGPRSTSAGRRRISRRSSRPPSPSRISPSPRTRARPI